MQYSEKKRLNEKKPWMNLFEMNEMLTEDAAKILFEAFVQRKDTYTLQTEGGTYQRITKDITLKTIKDHLEGKKSIGVYQFSKENKLKWICFDFDGKLNEQKELAKTFAINLKKDGFSPLIEFSGKKGYHVWIFCNETDGASAKYWAEHISEGFGIHEIFPKQEEISGYGNCVKLPLCIHQVSKGRSYFLDENFDELSTIESVEFLQKISKEEKAALPKVIVKETIRTIIRPAAKTEMPSYIQYLINNGAREGERHKGVFILTKELFHHGFAKDEIMQHAQQFNLNCTPPKKEYIITNHVNTLLEYSDRYLAKEITEDKSYEEIKDMEKVDYHKVIATYKKWFYLKNDGVIDLALAIAISRKEKMQPLWVIMIAPSGSGKSEFIRPLTDDKQPSTTEIMSKITPNTFLSGISKKRQDHTDFAETLANTPKLFLTYDFAQFIKLDSEKKAQIWAQLRDLYDGFIERKAYDVNKKVENIKVNWIICSTPVVDSEILIHQELGTRELIYRFNSKEIEKKDLMKTIWENSEILEEMRKELKQATRAYIEKRETEGFWKVKIETEVRKELESLSLTIATLRAATESDSYTGELTNFVYEEMPTRILLQMKDLFVSLKNLDKDYPDKKAISILKRIALSSIHPIRLQIILELIKSAPLSTTDIQKRLSIGWKSVITQLYTAKQLNLVDYTELEGDEGQTRNWKKKSWYLTDHPVTTYLKQIQEISLPKTV